MTTDLVRRALTGRGALYGIASGLAYGLMLRVAIDALPAAAFLVMSVAFLVAVPMGVGYLTVSAVPTASRLFAFFAPWLTVALSIGATMLTGLEGLICVVFGSPLMLLAASAGGFIGRNSGSRSSAARLGILLLPAALGGMESCVPLADRRVTTTSEIDIAAPVAAVWPLVVSVDSIGAAERRPALFTSIGFPAPVAATLDGEGVGSVRTATFERGVVFHERVTAWEAGRRLSFTIAVEQVPPDALDDHVAVGGPFFDVLTGTYELTPLAGGGTRLRLVSEHRVATHFNWYAAWWAEAVMQSIQRNILEVLQSRAERAAREGRAA